MYEIIRLQAFNVVLSIAIYLLAHYLADYKHIYLVYLTSKKFNYYSYFEDIFLPSSNISFAIFIPNNCGNNTEDPNYGPCNILTKGAWKVALDVAHTLSKNGSIVNVKPTVMPWHTANKGLSNPDILKIKFNSIFLLIYKAYCINDLS